MDIIIIIIIVGLLGILITLGNERNRAAIEQINKTAQDWAVQDLRMKRGATAKSIEVTDPVSWFNKASSRALEEQVDLAHAGSFADVPSCVVFSEANSGKIFIYSPHSAKDLRQILRTASKKSNRLDDVNTNPLAMKLPKTAEKTAVLMNIVNAGVLFDLELATVWPQYTRQTPNFESLWLYRLDL